MNLIGTWILTVLLIPSSSGSQWSTWQPHLYSKHGIQTEAECEAAGKAEVEAIRLVWVQAKARYACVRVSPPRDIGR